MNREEILNLDPNNPHLRRILFPKEIIHIAKVLGAFWRYDYKAAKQGRIGLHAELKSGLCSDGFFISRILLEKENICEIFANQLVLRVEPSVLQKVDYAAGIPNGATRLGEKFSQITGIRCAKMHKINGKIKLLTELKPGEIIVVIEDFITRGTGFEEAIIEIKNQQPDVKIQSWIPAIINRGGLKEKNIPNIGSFWPLAIADIRINDWEQTDCPLCQMGSSQIGSKRIRPKATDENWRLITTSQLPI